MAEIASIQEASGSKTVSIDKPVGLEVGDLMIVILAAQGGSNDVNTIGAPTGWTLYVNDGGERYNQNLTGYYKVADQDDVNATSFSFTASSSGTPTVIGSLARIIGGNYGDMNVGVNGQDLDSYNSDNLLVFVSSGSDSSYSTGSITFSNYQVTGGATPSFTEQNARSMSPGDGAVGFGIADAIYSSDGTVTNYTVSVSPSGATIDRSMFLIPPAILPDVDTNPADEVKRFSAKLNGDINNESQATQRGFVYGTVSQADPGNVAPGDSGYQEFSEEFGEFNISSYDEIFAGLQSNTTYYFRFYAKSATGFSYGLEVSFKTLREFAPVIDSVDPQAALINTTPEITIKGKEFYAGLTVEIDGESCTNISIVGSETVTCNVPSSSEQKASTLTLTNEDAQADTADFMYIEEVKAPAQPGAVSANVTIQPIGITT